MGYTWYFLPSISVLYFKRNERINYCIFHIEMLFCFVGCFPCGLFYLCFLCSIVLRCALRNVRKDYNTETCFIYKNVANNDLSAILRKLCFAFLKGSRISINIYNKIFCSIWNDNTQTHPFSFNLYNHLFLIY